MDYNKIQEASRILGLYFTQTEFHCNLTVPETKLTFSCGNRKEGIKNVFTFHIGSLEDRTHKTGIRTSSYDVKHFVKDYENFPVTINIAEDKTAERIASDLKRRFIDPLTSLWQVMQEHHNRQISHHIGEERITRDAEAIIKTVPGYRINKRYVSKDSITVELRSITIEELRNIAKILKPNGATA